MYRYEITGDQSFSSTRVKLSNFNRKINILYMNRTLIIVNNHRNIFKLYYCDYIYLKILLKSNKTAFFLNKGKILTPRIFLKYRVLTFRLFLGPDSFEINSRKYLAVH